MSNQNQGDLACAMMSPVRRKKPNVGECAGSTAAECAAVCCCCPFVLVDFLVLAVFKLPHKIWRRMWLNRGLGSKSKKKPSLVNKYSLRDSGRRGSIHCFDDEVSKLGRKISIEGATEAVDLDEEMWERFQSTGFGRSLSQRYV